MKNLDVIKKLDMIIKEYRAKSGNTGNVDVILCVSDLIMLRLDIAASIDFGDMSIDDKKEWDEYLSSLQQ